MTVSLNGFGTPESVWDAAGLPMSLPEVDWEDLLPDGGRVVLVAPHPDDEVLGAGGLLAELASRGVPVLVIAVTDGEASHPDRVDELRRRRIAERADALARLGSQASVVRLEHPDGEIDAVRLRSELIDLVGVRDVVLAPWSRDGHPDHDACGQAADGLGRRSWSYLVWTWHWAGPPDVPWDRAVRVPMSPEQLSAKRKAVAAYTSQLEGEDPILPAHVRVRLLRDAEVLLS